MAWYGWLILGAILLAAELFAIDAQFYLVFMGLSAIIVGLGNIVGFVMPEWVQWLAFAALSVLSMFTFRRRIYEKLRGSAVGFNQSIAGNSLRIGVDLAPGAETRTEYRGTNWTVRNVGDTDIKAGATARIQKVDGLTLHLSSE